MGTSRTMRQVPDAAGLATAISNLANVLAFSGLFGGGSQDEEQHPAQGLLFTLLAPIGATLVQLGISRSREYLADEAGAPVDVFTTKLDPSKDGATLTMSWADKVYSVELKAAK